MLISEQNTGTHCAPNTPALSLLSNYSTRLNTTRKRPLSRRRSRLEFVSLFRDVSERLCPAAARLVFACSLCCVCCALFSLACVVVVLFSRSLSVLIGARVWWRARSRRDLQLSAHNTIALRLCAECASLPAPMAYRVLSSER